MPRAFVGFLITVVGTIPLLSCTDEESPTNVEAPRKAFAVRESVGAGPVRFTLELSSDAVTTADAFTCRLTLDVADGFEAEFPDLAFPEDMPGAVLTDYDEQVETDDGRRVAVRTYEFEPEYEGTLELPTMEVYYHRAEEVEESVLQTEPIEITVSATPATADVLELAPMRGLISVERIEAEQRRIWPWVLLAGVLAAGLFGLLVWWVRHPRPVPPPPPAHEVALARLRKLAEGGLRGSGRAEPFFVEVTGIVRDYVEQAFGLRAPEQTTEEFLNSMVREPAVARHRGVLQPFLTAADEVKFARLSADRAVMQRAFDTAEDFVRQSSGAAVARPAAATGGVAT